MKLSSLKRITSSGDSTSRSRSSRFSGSLLFALSFAVTSQAISFAPIPSANLDLSNLGRVGLLGDFDGISLYEFEGQNENGYFTNGSQSVMAQAPNGGFINLATADAGIHTMCSFSLDNGKTSGVIVGGNFTSLGGIESQGVAIFNPNTSSVSSLMGISGQVNAVLCDNATNSVYVGGLFQGVNSTNALAWTGTSGWTNLPFLGFNGAVNAISKSSKGNIIFAGQFTGLGNTSTPKVADEQILNIAGANIVSVASASTTGFSDPRNILCKTSGVDGPGNTWLLEDGAVGSWTATFGFMFQPTKLRLWNTHLNGRGTKTWRYTALPLDGIMNFTYTDPVTKQNQSCTSECPLSNDPTVQFQDFYFVNTVGMNAFRVDISNFYGAGGGLNGIELFQNNIHAYAVDNFNEPNCTNIALASTSTQTGPWAPTSSGTSADSGYLTATSVTQADTATVSVVFYPDIKQSGNYSVNMYTPGCMGDGTCPQRGQVNVTGIMASGKNAQGFTTSLYQTNDYEKFDQIYFGYVEAGSAAFRPSVTLRALSSPTNNLTIVAQRVAFILVDSAGGLNGLFEYNPKDATVSTSDFSSSPFDAAGTTLDDGASITSLAALGDTTYVGGNFNTKNFANMFAVNDTGTTSLAAGGLNNEVRTMALKDTTLFLGGSFNNTVAGTTPGLSNVAAYDTATKTWSALGAGVDREVFNIVPMSMNITGTTPETVIALTGDFTELLPFGRNSSVSVSGFAIWVPSQANWLQNLNVSTAFINGQLSTALPSSEGALFAGTLNSQQLRVNGAAELSSARLTSFPVSLNASSSASKSNSQDKGIVTALFYNSGNTNLTVLAGHFSALASNGSTVNNLVFVNNTVSDVVTGIGSQISNDSTFLTAAISGSTLFAGGNVSGTVGGDAVAGIISYDLQSGGFTRVQPPALSGGNGTVNAIAIKPDTSDVYVGGAFTSAGSLPCPGVCVFTSLTSQWNRPSNALSGTANAMLWSDKNTLLVGGTLTIGGASVSLASFDAKTTTWSAYSKQELIPGSVTTLVAANRDDSQLWVAGTAKNGTDFIMKYDGSTWSPINVLGPTSKVRGLQVFPLKSSHSTSALVPQNEALLITGNLVVPGFGNASSATFNGTALRPFALATKSNSAGSISQVFTETSNFFASPSGKLALGFIVLIGLAIALGLTFLLVVGGTVANRIQRKREGYVPAPSAKFFDKGANLDRVPPERLFGSMAEGGRSAPMI